MLVRFQVLISVRLVERKEVNVAFVAVFIEHNHEVPVSKVVLAVKNLAWA